MQETSYATKDNSLMRKLQQEFFSGVTEEAIIKKMDERLETLKDEGHTFVRRIPKIGRNASCQCGSGKKFKKCCISKVQE